MAQPFGQTGTADPIAAEYFTWKSAAGPLRVLIHLDAIDGLARDVIERSQGLPVEVGGLLLGHANRGDKPSVWIERYQRIECEHRSGPHFVLTDDELAHLETRASELAASGDLDVVGFYRSHLRDGFGLDAPDRQLIARYFKDPEDLFLLIGPASGTLHAQFFLHGSAGEILGAEPEFPFRGRAIASLEPDDPRERTGRSSPVAAAAGERLGRLVPDFIPPAPRSPLPPLPELPPGPPTEDLERRRGFLNRRWPLLAAFFLVAGGAVVFLQQAGHREAPSQTAPAAETTPAYPIGLYADPAGSDWRLSWNPAATAVQGARGAKLFVRDGDDQTPIDLSVKDLQKGSYQIQAKSNDVTFRLEITDASGRVSAESFRLLKSEPKTAETPLPSAPSATPPVATHKEAPIVPASIRPRIKGKIPVEVRVQIDAQGRVLSATPVTKAHSGLETFLAGRAVAAAEQWRFKPARENGKPVPGTQLIHFTFEK